MTRAQFITSICAIPFIGKLFKPKTKYIPFGKLTTPTGPMLVLENTADGWKRVITKDGVKTYVDWGRSGPHVTKGKTMRHFQNEKGEWVFEDVEMGEPTILKF